MPYYTRVIKRFGGALIELSDGNPLSLTSLEITLHMLRYSQPDIDLQLICYDSQSQVWLLTCTDSYTKTPRVAIQSKQRNSDHILTHSTVFLWGTFYWRITRSFRWLWRYNLYQRLVLLWRTTPPKCGQNGTRATFVITDDPVLVDGAPLLEVYPALDPPEPQEGGVQQDAESIDNVENQTGSWLAAFGCVNLDGEDVQAEADEKHSKPN